MKERMNYGYLMRHISYHLHTFVRRYTADFDYAESFCGRIQFEDIFSPEELVGYFTSRADFSLECPVLLSFNGQFLSAFVPGDEYHLIIGPVRLSEEVYLRHQAEAGTADEAWLKTVPECSFKELSGDVLLAFNLCREIPLDEVGLLAENCIRKETDAELRAHFSELVFENREHGRRHNPYDQELREGAAVEQGDLKQLETAIKEDFLGEYGTLAKNPIRHTRNIGIVVVTLASRAAIRGGVPYEIAYTLSDSTIQKLEECSDIPTLFHIFRSAEFTYAQMVKDLNEQKAGMSGKDKNPHINRCKDYIFSHLHDKICVQDIADELGLNANYFSELFHQCEKISLTDFIRREKMNLVKNLLIYSRYSCSEIAAYLGFSSQSHMGKQFRECMGMTPNQYRREYGVREFDV